MSDRDAFERSMASLYDAMLDDTRWPVASALIDEACGLTGNGLVVGDPADSEGWGSSRIAMITGLLPGGIARFVRRITLTCIIHEGPDSTAKGRDRRRNGSRTSPPASGANRRVLLPVAFLVPERRPRYRLSGESL